MFNGKEDWELYALCALLIAAKSNETDEKIPKSGHLIRHLTNLDTWTEVIQGYTAPRLVKCEREILNAINWNYENHPNFYAIIDLLKS